MAGKTSDNPVVFGDEDGTEPRRAKFLVGTPSQAVDGIAWVTGSGVDKAVEGGEITFDIPVRFQPRRRRSAWRPSSSSTLPFWVEIEAGLWHGFRSEVKAREFAAVKGVVVLSRDEVLRIEGVA